MTGGNQFKFIVPYSFICQLDNGSIQYVHGKIGKYGQWENENQYFVYLPINEDEKFKKRLDEQTAFLIDWYKVIDKIKDSIKENLISENDIQTLEIKQLLIKIQVMQQIVDQNVIINGQPQVNYYIVQDYQFHSQRDYEQVIDIAAEVQDIVPKKEEEVQDVV